jgi:hypothetical protein
MSQRLVFNYIANNPSGPRVYVTPLICAIELDNPEPKYGQPAGNGFLAEGLTDEEWNTLSDLLDRVCHVRDIPLAKEEA